MRATRVWGRPAHAVQVQKPASSGDTFLQGAPGYALGQITLADTVACQGLLSQVNSVLISPEADRLLVARGKVADSSSNGDSTGVPAG